LDNRRSLNDIEVTKAITVAAQILRRLAIPDPGHFPYLKDMAAEIAASLHERWVRQARPFSQYLLETACDLATQLGPTARNLLVNYDIHYADVLAGSREPWLAVDPKPIIGDPEYGIAQLLWRRLEDIVAGGGLDYHFGLLVETAELDPKLAYGSTLIRCVDYWLWGLNIGLTEDPIRCKIITNWLLEAQHSK
jgi:streptomycin 6-kinase